MLFFFSIGLTPEGISVGGGGGGGEGGQIDPYRL